MAKIIPMELIASMSGKVCKHGDTYFVTNRQTGQVHTGRLCNPSDQAPTAGQLAVRAKFAQRAQNASAWLAENKPSDSQPKGTEAYQKALEGYRAQHKIGSFFGYVAKHITEEGTLDE